MKNKILSWIYSKNSSFFEKKVLGNIASISFSEKELENIFTRYEYFFELLLIKSFTGYIPKDVNEPSLKFFKEYGEQMERWTLWQSWYVNRKALNDPLKVPFYNGMMVYLKILNTVAGIQKKNAQPKMNMKQEELVVEPSYIEKALQGIDEFNQNVNKPKVQSTESAEDKTK